MQVVGGERGDPLLDVGRMMMKPLWERRMGEGEERELGCGFHGDNQGACADWNWDLCLGWG